MKTYSIRIYYWNKEKRCGSRYASDDVVSHKFTNDNLLVERINHKTITHIHKLPNENIGYCFWFPNKKEITKL